MKPPLLYKIEFLLVSHVKMQFDSLWSYGPQFD